MLSVTVNISFQSFNKKDLLKTTGDKISNILLYILGGIMKKIVGGHLIPPVVV